MADNAPNESKQHTTGSRRSSTFVLSREKFDAVPGYRARYIVSYILVFLWWVAPKAVYLLIEAEFPYWFATPYYVVLVALYIPFLFYFSRAMHTLGYPIYWTSLTLIVVALPFPGILAMGYMDRKIADTWDKADDAHQKYRQRVTEDEESGSAQ